jgi:hypothetical protein
VQKLCFCNNKFLHPREKKLLTSITLNNILAKKAKKLYLLVSEIMKEGGKDQEIHKHLAILWEEVRQIATKGVSDNLDPVSLRQAVAHPKRFFNSPKLTG